MGCFTVLRSTKKKYEHFVNKKDTSRREVARTPPPEPENREPSLQSAPPSFRNRTKGAQSASRASNSRARALSAPSTLIIDQDALSMELEDQEEYGGWVESKRFSNPLPLPLPSTQGNSVLRNMGSFKSTNPGSPIPISGPLPLPPLGGGGLRKYSFEEISAACQQFSSDTYMSDGISSTIYKATFGDDTMSSKKLEATVTRLMPSTQTFKEFVNEVNTIASLQHPQLCKLLGFHAREGSDQRMLVYERLFHGSLDRLLFGRSDGPSIDWSARVKVALCAAQGLAFLHEEGPFQAMYNDFSTANIQVDKDFSAKLSGYGCVCYNPETDILNTSVATASLSVETVERGLLTPKSNVWSFGIVLLELLTGRKNLDSRHPKEERNIVKWSKPFLADDCRLSLIMDPRIKARCPPKAARSIADIAQKCLQKDPSERPTMRSIVDTLKNVQDMKCPIKTLEEPIVESEANAAPASQTPEETGTCEVGGDGAEDPREAKSPSIPSEENSAPPAAPATDLEKKARRAERFGLPVQLSEQEKRNSRAERFGVRSNTIGKIEAGNLEDEKRKARAERFGLTGQSLEDDKVKKKSRLENLATNPKPISVEEEEKRKARTLRFSGTSDEISKGNSKATAEVKAAVTETEGT